MTGTTAIYNDNFLNAQRQKGDVMADAFIAKSFTDADSKTALRDLLQTLTDNRKLNNLPSAYFDEAIFKKAIGLPEWADRKLMKKGAAFFATHAEVIMNLLGLLSLPYCYTAANGAMVLYLSERLRLDAEKRLFETADFVWDVMAPDAFEENGKGFAAILKVRLIHSAARYYTLKSAKWDMSWGLPINQEDMAGTNLSFSFIVVRGLRRLGFTILYPEQEAFMHLWNVIGYLTGVDDQLLPHNGKDALKLEKSIKSRQFGESLQGKALTQSLIDYFSTVNTGAAYSPADVIGLMRYLLGDEVSQMLGIKGQMLSSNQLTLMRIINLFSEYKPVPSFTTAYQKAHTKFKRQNIG